jgi:DNA-binding transcriptional ArsR family regulator
MARDLNPSQNQAKALHLKALLHSTKWLTNDAAPPNAPCMTQQKTSSSKHLDQTFAALADPSRRAILMMLLEDDMAVTDVAEPFEISLAAISKHLLILSRAGLITQEKRGRVKWCKLEPDAMRAASIWMQGFGQFEALDLDGLERFLEAELPED